MESYGELRAAIEKVELVDAHAHNLVALHSSLPFINCFTEATGDYALSSAPHTLSFKRSLRDIAELYGCDSSLEQVHKYRQSKGVESLASTCFKAARISTLLIDDGVVLDNKYDLDWHNIAARNVARICRIERLAEEVLDKGLEAGIVWTLDTFTEAFTDALKSVASLIVGFKSIAAYRSGLEINTNISDKDAEAGLNENLRAGRPLRIENKNLIDHIFILGLEVAQSFDLPVQIHTGFGDNDLDLRLANPLQLRQLLEDKRFTKCRLVLLHASYPYTKEASYLASVYPQVYLDFGLAVPKLSVHGMISSVKELLELAPINKVMFSTDGIAFPETFYLGAKRGREVVFSVLRDACIDGDLSISEAVVAAQDILANNAIHFYKIRAANKSEPFENALFSPANVAIESQETVISFVRILWIDASGQHRCRVVPAKRFDDVVKKNGLGLTEACMAMSSSTDCPADGSNLSGVGEIRLVPELSTKIRIPWMTHEEMVLANMEVKHGVGWEYCPREVLRRVSKVLKDEFDMVMNAGFENEFYLLRNVSRHVEKIKDGKEEWVPFDSTPYCSTSAYDAASPFLHEVVTCMRSLNIPVEQLHAESGNGQFEIALGHGVCTYSADNLIFAREVIRSVARKHGLLATFVPKYSLQGIGSGSHVHISLSKNGENVFMGSHGSSLYGISKTGQEFMAGVLRHLPSILAFTAPIPNSYDRIQPNTWSGAYLCWGRENREAPLRTACPPGISEGLVSNFEIKSFDGCANPHLGLASIIAAGIDGLRRQLTLPDPIDVNPADCKSGVQMLPRSLAESVEALRNDNVMKELIGEKLLVAIDAIRKAEINHYSKDKEAWKQLIYHY